MFEGVPLKEVPNVNPEREFYRRRYEAMIKAHNAKWINRIKNFAGVVEFTEEDMAYREAVRENEERELFASPEYQKWEKHLKAVIDELVFVRDNPEQAEREGKRPMLLIMGGGMRGVYATGQLLALKAAGLDKVFKIVGGSSAGSGPAAFLAAGGDGIERAARLFTTDCAGTEFLDPTRISKILDTTVIANAMRSGEKSLDTAAIQQSDMEVFALATNVDSMQVDIIDMKTCTTGGVLDPIAACVASSAIPLFNRIPIEVNGQKCLDGSVLPVPLFDLIEKYKPTCLLVLSNTGWRESEQDDTTVMNLLLKLVRVFKKEGSLASAYTNFAKSLELTLQMMTTSEMERDQIELLADTGAAADVLNNVEEEFAVKIAIAFPPSCGVTPISNNSNITKNAIYTAARHFYQKLTGEEMTAVEF